MNETPFDLYDHSPIEPHKLEEIYASGFAGVRFSAYERIAFHAACSESFYTAFPEAKGVGKGKLSLPYRAALVMDPEFGKCEAQTTGDCVSHSTRNAGMVDYCVDAYFGETSYEGRLATEPIYGYRGHSGQGASCDRLARYVSQEGPGGFLVRKEYSGDGGSVDLSKYDSRIGHNWGRSGTPNWLNKIAAENKALRVFPCESEDMAKDALYLGFGLSRCGWWGYSSKRDSSGISDTQGRWAHAMACIGCDDTADETLYLIQNSWGTWNSGPKRHEQPDGSFWIRSKYFAAEIKEGGVYVIASVRGFDRELVYDRASQLSKELYQ